MRVYIGPYKNWIGPYQIADKIFFWVDHKGYCSDEKYEQKMARWDYKMHSRFGDWLAETWVYDICEWIHSKKKREIRVEIDEYDTWGMDNTLALIIVPMLKQLRDTKHGSPYVYPEDCPHIGKGQETDFGNSDDKVHDRWDWVLDEMIYAFEAEANEDWENQYYSGEHDIYFEKNDDGNSTMKRGPKDTFKVDREAMDKDAKRRENGRRLFAKYYRGLWD
jgi:hypothetical protein